MWIILKLVVSQEINLKLFQIVHYNFKLVIDMLHERRNAFKRTYDYWNRKMVSVYIVLQLLICKTRKKWLQWFGTPIETVFAVSFESEIIACNSYRESVLISKSWKDC
jgi:hypothetical protein